MDLLRELWSSLGTRWQAPSGCRMDPVCGSIMPLFLFFFKLETAYEMLRSLVGSEMCIRDSHDLLGGLDVLHLTAFHQAAHHERLEAVSYTHLTLPRSYACRSRWSPYHHK